MQGSMGQFLSAHSLSPARRERIAKGWSSEVFLVQRKSAHGKKQKGGKFALKIEKEKSPRMNMVEREAENLRLANSVGVGPKLISFDTARRIILMEFIDGVTLQEFLFSVLSAKIKNKKQRAKILHNFLDRIFAQARALDEAGIDHGQLAGKGKNILVRERGSGYEPVIIDFEKASPNRKVHNSTQLESFLMKPKYGAFAKKVNDILQG